MSETAIDDLVTLRDWLRYGVSRFTEAGLVFGHGTSTALDEAAYLILASLHLPIDQLEPWLEARLTRDERSAIANIFERRIATRKPAAYLTGEAWMHGHRFRVDERVIVPRSYIGELLQDRLAAVVTEPDEVSTILDLCTGSGCLAILAALAFPRATVDAAELSMNALAVARNNVRDYRFEDRVRLVQSDLFSGLEGRTYDLVISNPPYVSAASVAAFPPEYRAEPLMAHAGGEDGLDLVRRILDEAPRHLNPGGALVVEIGMGRDILEAERPDLPFLWLDTAESEGEVLALSAADLAGKPRKSARPRKSKA
jgi:ribosomal protein L3 glutamine methyltransferase